VLAVSIIRVGLAETKKFAEGYASIFGSKKKKDQQESTANPPAQEKQEAANKDAKPGKKKGKK